MVLQLVTSKGFNSNALYVFALLDNYPNPFNGVTNLEYKIQFSSARVVLDIFDLQGQLVKRLVEKIQAGGSYRVVWDGTDQTGKIVSSGFYFGCLSVNGKQHVKRLLLLR
jgi:flagellar hook assembly protein FlgD